MTADVNYPDSNRRFQIISRSNLPNPGCCITCGSVDRACIWFGAMNYIHIPNTDGSEDRYGSVLICTLCFASAVMENPELNLMTLETHESIIADISVDARKLRRVDRAINQLRTNLVSATGDFYDTLSGDFPDIVAVNPVEAKSTPHRTTSSDSVSLIARNEKG